LSVRFSPEAIADLQEMYDYIEPRGGKAVAAAYISRIYQYCLDMGMFPERGIKRDDLWTGLRFVGFKRQATIAIELTASELRVVRILGRGRDVESELEHDVFTRKHNQRWRDNLSTPAA
jgi:toxin ParE1/3/4